MTRIVGLNRSYRPCSYRLSGVIRRGKSLLDADRGSRSGSDSILMQFALTLSSESAGDRHHGSWNDACSVRARH
jgi:hypothetical protein